LLHLQLSPLLLSCPLCSALWHEQNTDGCNQRSALAEEQYLGKVAQEEKAGLVVQPRQAPELFSLTVSAL